MLAGALNCTAGLADQVALPDHLPQRADHHRQVRRRRRDQETLTIPDGNIAISVNLSDTGRVAGFVNPGAKVAIFLTTNGDKALPDITRLLLPKVQVIAVGATTVVSTTTTDASGRADHRAAAQDAVHPGVNQAEAQKHHVRRQPTASSPSACSTTSPRSQPGPGVTATNLFR